MPIYEFYCEYCKNRVEHLLTHEEAEQRRECEECGRPLVKLPSAAAFNIKGFSYKNRYGLKKGKK